MSAALTITGTDFGGPAEAPLLLLGPSLGTSAATLWATAARRLAARFRVIAWDLPGHGSTPAHTTGFAIADLAAAVVALVDRVEPAATFHYAGDSVGGCVGLQLALDSPNRIRTVSVLCSGAAIGTADSWADRAATVRASGTSALLATQPQRWFAAGFVETHPDVSSTLLHALRDTDAESYALLCEALGRFDVTDRLGEISSPVLCVAGAQDVATPVESLSRIVSGVSDGALVVVDGVGHLAPAEMPLKVADLIAAHAAPDVYTAGMAVRRDVLGDEHVDRSIAATTDFTADFQDLITRYAWGTIWTRPGLDRRSRSLITLTALVARGHHEELAMHLRAARRNGLTVDEIKEVLLQTAIYCGVPDANTAFRIAAQVLS
ncbi:MAG: 4-carboxymuconolactone decarboxylase [Mycobacterium sp.]